MPTNVTPVFQFHTYSDRRVDLTITGEHGTLTLSFETEGPSIAVRDPARGAQRYKAVCELFANGHLKGWFVAHKGNVPTEDTLVFFPARKKPLPVARRTKSVRKEG